jgi:hypothetical protein
MNEGSEFERAAAAPVRAGLLRDFWHLLAQNKKWWLLPILSVLLIVGTLIFLSGSALAPFIYSLF